MYSLLLAIIYLAFISLGLPDSLLGSAWPAMRQGFQVPLSYAGYISMIVQFGTISSSLLSERLTRRLSTKYVTLFSVAMTAAALMGFSLSSEFWMLCLWAIPYGLGAGAIDSALNNYVALHYSSRHMNWLHSFWGVGTIISPYIMSFALTQSAWPTGYRLVSLIQIGIALVLLCSLPLWKINQHKNQSDAGQPVIGLRRALKIHGVPQLLLGFFAYCTAESITMLWTSSYLVAMKGLSTELAAAYASLFFIGITAGRMIAGFLTEKLGDQRMIRMGFCIALAGILCIFLPIRGSWATLAGFVVFGLGCAPIYPSIIHSTPANFGAENSQAIIGIQMASAYTGSALMPPLFGLIANRVGLWIMPLFMLAFLVLMIVLLEVAYRKARQNFTR